MSQVRGIGSYVLSNNSIQLVGTLLSTEVLYIWEEYFKYDTIKQFFKPMFFHTSWLDDFNQRTYWTVEQWVKAEVIRIKKQKCPPPAVQSGSHMLNIVVAKVAMPQFPRFGFMRSFLFPNPKKIGLGEEFFYEGIACKHF